MITLQEKKHLLSQLVQIYPWMRGSRLIPGGNQSIVLANQDHVIKACLPGDNASVDEAAVLRACHEKSDRDAEIIRVPYVLDTFSVPKELGINRIIVMENIKGDHPTNRNYWPQKFHHHLGYAIGCLHNKFERIAKKSNYFDHLPHTPIPSAAIRKTGQKMRWVEEKLPNIAGRATSLLEHFCSIADKRTPTLVHRDLYAKNMIVDPDGRISFLDYASPTYMIPERDFLTWAEDPLILSFMAAGYQESRGVALDCRLTSSFSLLVNIWSMVREKSPGSYTITPENAEWIEKRLSFPSIFYGPHIPYGLEK